MSAIPRNTIAAITIIVVVIVAAAAYGLQQYLSSTGQQQVTTSETQSTSSILPQAVSFPVNSLVPTTENLRVAPTENRSKYVNPNVTVQSDLKDEWIWDSCRKYNVTLDFNASLGSYSVVIVRNITIRLLVNGQQAEARFKNLTLEMKPRASVHFEGEINTCTGELENLKAEICSKLSGELKVDVEVRVNTKLVFEHSDFTLFSKEAKFCDAATGLLDLFGENICLKEPQSEVCGHINLLHTHTDFEGSEELPPQPDPDDPVKILQWSTSAFATSAQLYNYGSRQITINAIYAVSLQQDNLTASPFLANMQVLPGSTLNLTFKYPGGQPIGVIVFYGSS